MFQFIIDIVKFKINRAKVQIFLKLTKNIFIFLMKMLMGEVVMGDVMVMIEIMIEGEMVSLALGFLMFWGDYFTIPR